MTVGHSTVNDRAYLANGYSKTGYSKHRTFFGVIEPRRDNGDTAGTRQCRPLLRGNFSDATLPIILTATPLADDSSRDFILSLRLILSLSFSLLLLRVLSAADRGRQVKFTDLLNSFRGKLEEFLLRLHFHPRFWMEPMLMAYAIR